MSNNDLKRERIESLLARDDAMTSFQFDEFRMNLATAVQEIERRGRRFRRASLWGLAITIACMASILPLEMLKLPASHPWIPTLWRGSVTMATIVTGILAGINQYKYQPAANQARSDLQMAMFAQLQQQVAELQKSQD